jgi:RNA polymerase sigma factor (sigma-70 family)
VTASNGKDARSSRRAAEYLRYAPAIRAYAARRVEADAVDDIVAETFAIAWRRLPSEAEPLPWLYGVARRVVHGHRRSHARRLALVRRLISRQSASRPSHDPADLFSGDPELARAFATLSELEREAICLVAWEALGNAEAAKVAGCSASTFAVRLSRAKARLSAALEPAAGPTSPVPNPPTPTLEACHDR